MSTAECEQACFYAGKQAGLRGEGDRGSLVKGEASWLAAAKPSPHHPTTVFCTSPPPYACTMHNNALTHSSGVLTMVASMLRWSARAAMPSRWLDSHASRGVTPLASGDSAPAGILRHSNASTTAAGAVR